MPRLQSRLNLADPNAPRGTHGGAGSDCRRVAGVGATPWAPLPPTPAPTR